MVFMPVLISANYFKCSNEAVTRAISINSFTFLSMKAALIDVESIVVI